QGRFAGPIFFNKLAPMPRKHDSPSLMISGVNGTRSGYLKKRVSHLGGRPSERNCRVWNFVLDDCRGVVDGDCGSLVVDSNTLEAYGHVVGSNPLGEAYVVPLEDTIAQVRTDLRAKEVHL
ncbi:hypothetical protein AOQ84DRAFT_269229, partial [Glonium stellatum]